MAITSKISWGGAMSPTPMRGINKPAMVKNPVDCVGKTKEGGLDARLLSLFLGLILLF